MVSENKMTVVKFEIEYRKTSKERILSQHEKNHKLWSISGIFHRFISVVSI